MSLLGGSRMDEMGGSLKWSTGSEICDNSASSPK